MTWDHPLLAGGTCTPLETTLDPGNVTTCTATYTVVVGDLALAGVEALQANAASPKYRSTNQVSNQTRKARHVQHIQHH